MSDKLAGGIKAGATSVTLPVELRKSADSIVLTGIIHSGVTASYWRQGGVRVAITPVTLGSVNAAWASGGFVEVDATNMPGLYRFDVPDAAFAPGADWVVISLKVATAFQLNFMFALESVGAAELATSVGDVPTNAELATALAAADDAMLVQLATVAAYVDTEVAAIKAKTDNLPSDPADQSLIIAATDAIMSRIGVAGAGLTEVVSDVLAGITSDHGGGSYSAGSSGSGAFAVTVTVVDDNDDPVENASVRLTEGVSSFFAQTDEDGVASFSLDVATYGIAITKAGYQFTPTEIAVAGAGDHEQQVTAVTIPAPANPDQATGYITTRDQVGVAKANVAISFQMITGPGEGSHQTSIFQVKSDEDGLVQVALAQSASYQARRGKDNAWVEFTVPGNNGTFELPQILGTP